MDEKEIHYTNKHVDETWKQQVSKESSDEPFQPQKTRLSFLQFVTSLGLQSLICMGEMKASGSGQIEINLEAAKETIDLLILLKEKTKGNLTVEEDKLISSLIPDLQMKFVQHQAS